MSRRGGVSGFRRLQARGGDWIYSYTKSEGKKPNAGKYLYVCESKTCQLTTYILDSDEVQLRCCRKPMSCRKIESDGQVDQIDDHVQNIWACTTCPTPPERDTLRDEAERGCNHEFVVYAVARE